MLRVEKLFWKRIWAPDGRGSLTKGKLSGASLGGRSFSKPRQRYAPLGFAEAAKAESRIRPQKTFTRKKNVLSGLTIELRRIGMLRSRNFWLNVVLAMLSVLLLLWLTFRFFHWYTNHGETIEVPQLVGLSEDDAMQQLEALGLEGLLSDTLYEVPDSLAFVPAGHVLDQSPRGGVGVKEGRKVRLFLRSVTPPMVSLPNLVNFSVNVARAELEAKGLVIESVITASGRPPKMELNPPIVELRHKGKALKPGQKVPKGSLVVLVVDELKEQDEDSLTVDDFLNNGYNSLPSNLNNETNP